MGNYSRGFCYLNNIAIAVKAQGKPTLILDIDGHHGNGTQEIFEGDKSVVYMSIHRSPHYPGTGLTSEGNAINYPLPVDCGEEMFLNALQKALGEVDLSKFESLAVSVGFDTHAGDLASLGLETSSFGKIGKIIAQLKKPTFFVFEGGYMGEQNGYDLDAFLRGYEENL
jgi:acetoin utilization deacetylase AcuC-like enzyme